MRRSAFRSVGGEGMSSCEAKGQFCNPKFASCCCCCWGQSYKPYYTISTNTATPLYILSPILKSNEECIGTAARPPPS
jgi:hypothetical protein